MKRPVKFLHAADFHLGSQFVGAHQRDEKLGVMLRQAVEDAYLNVIQTAIDEEVDFAVFAGDLFNTVNADYAAQGVFIAGLQQLEKHGIQSFLVAGNHDPLDGSDRLALPPSATLFSADAVEEALWEADGAQSCSIAGRSYATARVNANLATGFRRGDADNSVALLHTNVGPISAGEGYARSELQDLKDSGIDYWALGHIHQTQIVRDQNPCVVYAGTPQALNINELGNHGCYVVELDYGQASVRWVDTSVIDMAQVSVDISGATSLRDLRETIIATITAEVRATKPCLVRLTFTGTSSLPFLFDDEQATQLANSFKESQDARLKHILLDGTILNESVADVTAAMDQTQNDFLREIFDATPEELIKEFDIEKAFKINRSSLIKELPEMKEHLLMEEEFAKIVSQAKELLYRELMKEGD